MLISVCVCTYKRSSVVDTLASIAAQILPPGWRTEIVVVDNDEAGSAERAVREWCARNTVPVRYAIQPSRNIAATRNRALELARGGWLALIDDDERANPTWLGHLIRTAEQHGADAVIGNVIALYPPSAPPWVQRADPLSRDWGATGDRLLTGSSANALIRAELVRRSGIRFDEARGLSGGEDTDFFSRLHAAGAHIVVCAEAIVAETIPPARLDLDYLRNRALRSGQSYGEIRLRSLSPARRLAFLAAASGKAALFLALAAPLNRLARSAAWRLRIRGWLNTGKLRACLGRPLQQIY
ncbi:glycosyltransferase family 2 protein [Desertibaculum subflavum]|uniref:glycosyltransferase family 2 protein n=1 Tax=Desertibaculum subflavum TaxID=2268458 RepID=UPI000E675C2E